MSELGRVFEVVRYPVKSMAGVAGDSAFLGWHGLAGDRRFAFRRLGDHSDFPWLSASRLPELLPYHPVGLDETAAEPLPTQVRTPAGALLDLPGRELESEVAERLGSPVELMRLRHGIFDDAAVSVIALAAMAGVGREAGLDLDRRRFRANLLVETTTSAPFAEDGWVGATLIFGHDEAGPAVRVTARDVRCAMVNLDPDTAAVDKRVLKTIVRLNGNHTGVYGTVIRTGVIRGGDPVRLVV